MTYNNYTANGIHLNPSVIRRGDNVTVKYNGLLYNQGAHHLFLHLGYGSEWEETQDIEMSRVTDGFQATIPVSRYNSEDIINFTFKDCANNWDNNSGSNYTFELKSGDSL